MNRVMWKSKDGSVIAISNMHDNHLLNALRLTQERLRLVDEVIGKAYSYGAPDTDTEAGYYYEASLNDLENDSITLSLTEKALREEVEKRGLKPLPIRTKLMA